MKLMAIIYSPHWMKQDMLCMFYFVVVDGVVLLLGVRCY